MNLLWAHIQDQEPNARIHSFIHWKPDDSIEDHARLKKKIPGFPTATEKTYLLFDNGEGTYWDVTLWDFFFKRHRDFHKYRILLFCSYGSAASQPLCYNPGTPMFLDPAARVSLVCDDEPGDEFGKVELLLSPNEFDELIGRRRHEFTVADDLQTLIYSWTGGHAGAVADILTILFREVCFSNSLGIPSLRFLWQGASTKE